MCGGYPVHGIVEVAKATMLPLRTLTSSYVALLIMDINVGRKVLLTVDKYITNLVNVCISMILNRNSAIRSVGQNPKKKKRKKRRFN